MFKVGDKVRYVEKYEFIFNDLTINNIYTIQYVFSDKTLGLIESDCVYPIKYFISLNEYRKRQLEELCLKSEIK